MIFPVAVTVKGDTIDCRLRRRAAAVPQGGLNSTLNYTAAHATYPLKCMLTPGVRGNAGCYRPFNVEAPEGSILNCRRPAAVNLRTRTGWYIAPEHFPRAGVCGAPHRCKPSRACRSPPTSMAACLTARSTRTCCSWAAGRAHPAHHDGKSGMLYPTSAANTSIEMFESRVPVLVLEKAYMPTVAALANSAAALGSACACAALRRTARRRSFPSIRRALDSIQLACSMASRAGRLAGSSPIRRRTNIRDCGTGELVSVADETEIIEIVLAGGAGFGDPKRARPTIRRDRPCRRLRYAGQCFVRHTAIKRRPNRRPNNTKRHFKGGPHADLETRRRGRRWRCVASMSLADVTMAQGARKVLIIAAGQDIPNFDPHVATGYSPALVPAQCL